MRGSRRVFFVPLLGLLVFSAAVAAQERPAGGPGITVYSEKNFRGRSGTFREDVSNLRDSGFNDRIWSVRVAPGESWEVCVDRDYRGRCTVISGDEPDLGRIGWSNLISSMRRVREARPPQQESSGRSYLVIFERPDYRGRPATFDRPSPVLENFTGQAGSITIGDGVWEVCSGANFSGRCVTLDRSVPDLNALGMRDQVSSVRPARQGPQERPDFSGGRGWVLVLFDGTSYRGSPVTFDKAVPDLGTLARRVESVRIEHGVWELCEGPNFTGRCVTLDRSAPDLSPQGLRHRVGSIRPSRMRPR